MPQPFQLVEVGTIAERTPLDLWGGWTGENDALYLSTGSRLGSGQSKVFRHDAGTADDDWVDDGIPAGAETVNKLRDDGARLYAWFEEGGGRSFLFSRSLSAPGWQSEGLPGYVGGRGLDVGPARALVAGGATSASAGLEGALYAGPSGGPYAVVRAITPGLLWELEREGDAQDGALWEFWGGYTSGAALTFREGVQVENPSNWAAGAHWFAGAMYACGELAVGSPAVRRWTGAGWATVLSMSRAAMADHVFRVPREPPELWAVGNDPFQVYASLDGAEWDEVKVPDIATGHDTNQLTAVGYWQARVWVATRDAAGPHIRLFSDSGGGELLLQVI
jgi:hypothetical protein